MVRAAHFPDLFQYRRQTRTFYRNAINSGLPIVECPELYPAVHEGDHIQIDLAAGVIRHHGADYTFRKFPDSMRKLLEAGGLAEYLKLGNFRTEGK